MLKLNLGAGTNLIHDEGWINTDKFPSADGIVITDMEQFPWPWEDNSVDTVLMNHSAEHVGQQPNVFIGIMKELYRVCAPDAKVHIHFPHHRHDEFFGDPTHVRPLLPATFELFSKKINLKVKELGAANSPLGLVHDVDFEIESVTNVLDDRFAYLKDDPTWERMAATMNSVVREVKIVLRVVKDAV